MPTTCLICCSDAEYFLLPPCNHKQMCWKCASTLIQGSTFSCPYCKGTPQGTSCILFVDQQQMKKYTFQQILKKNPFKSAAKSYQYYSNKQVAHFIEQSTSMFCRLCYQTFDTMNILKKHLNQVHRKQFCDVCLQNRKCIISEQKLYTDGELTTHMKRGQYSSEGQVVLYHPYCQFCKVRYYDIDSFRAHLRISTHLRCHICEQNFPKFKYIYYKDYQQIQRHFNKTHFVCQMGACLTKKLQNVYVSEQMLQQHKNRVHNKSGHKASKPVLNLLLFQQNKQQQLQWDRIGKDFSKQFQVVQKNVQLKNQQHRDQIIDIREFYPEQIKDGNKMSLYQVSEKLQDHLFKPEYKSQLINFVSVPLFCPLEMGSLTRMDLEKFIRELYQPKYSQSIIQIFFTKKFQYRSPIQYLSDVKRKMYSFSPISYYYVFPQLIRFFKDTNPTKQLMDSYYAQSLRNLKISNIFIFHKKQRYSDILNLIQQQIQSYIYHLMLQQKIKLQKYIQYLKDLNPTYYHDNHIDFFYVQKQKIKNMYHMVQKTKTSQLLKFNWLLKLGLSNRSHKIIYDKFYYKTVENCEGWVREITLQEIALLYAYSDICLQALIDKDVFATNKHHPHTLFLGTILSKIKTCISQKQLTSLKNIERQSVQLSVKLNSITTIQNRKNNKGIIINQQDHPTLLNQDSNNAKNNKNQIQIGWNNTRITNNVNIRVNKKNNNVKIQENQEFPELLLTNKNRNRNVKVQETVQQEQFPVFNYKDPKTADKTKKKQVKNRFYQQEQKNNIQKLGLFDKKITQNRWNKQKSVDMPSSNKKDFNWDNTKDNQWPTLDQTTILQNLKQETKESKIKTKKKNKNYKIQEEIQTKNEEILNQTIPEELIIKKKTKQQIKAQQQAFSKKNKKSKQEKPLSPQKPTQKPVQPAVKVEDQQKNKLTRQQRKMRKRRVRIDMTDSQQQQRKQQQQKQQERQQKYKKFQQQQKIKKQLQNGQGFEDSLLNLNKNNTNNTGNSIINQLIEQSKKGLEQKQPQIKIKKNRKGKAVVIERKGLGDL